MGHRHVYKLVRETKTKVLNISTSLILVAMSLGGALPTMLTSTAHAAGTNLYVNGAAGSNVHNCTDPTKPCRTINKAIENAAIGDTINVAAGTYNEDVVVNKDVTITGAGAGTTTIVATGQNTTPLTFSTNDATVSGFTIKHVYSTAEQNAWNFNNNGVFFAQGTHGNTLAHSTVTLNRNGIYLNNNTSATITDNTITDNRTGINLTNGVSGTVISDNTISHNWTVGLVYYSQGYATNFSSVTVANNTFTQNWYEEVEVKNAGASTGTLDLTSDTFNDNGPFWYSDSSDPSQNEPASPVPHPTELGGTDTMPTSGYPTIRIYNSPIVTINYTAVAPDTSSVTFVGGPKYVRINNAGDLDAQLVAPTWVSGVQFFVDGSSSPITGTNVGGAAANTDWWRLYTPLAAGTHSITAKVELGGSWYDVADTGTVYALGNPAGDFVTPSSDGQYFRPSDNPLRVTADDTNDSFADVVFHVDGKDYLVTRSQCDLREAGHRVLCDVNKALANVSRNTDTWTNLAEGHYTATATIYNQARNHINATSFDFNVDGTPPKMLSAKIVSSNQSVYKDSVVVAQYAQEANQLNGVSFYITQPRGDGQCDPNETKVLGPISAHFINRNGDKWYYRTTIDTSSLNGKYCIFSVAEDAAMNHSSPQEAKFSANFDNTAPDGSFDLPSGYVNSPTTVKVDLTANGAAGLGEQVITMRDANGQLTREWQYNVKTGATRTINGNGSAVYNYSSDTRSGTLTITFDSTGLNGTYNLRLFTHDQLQNSRSNIYGQLSLDTTNPTVDFTSPGAGSFVHNLMIGVNLEGTYSNLVEYGFDVSGPNGVHFSTGNYQVDRPSVTLTGFDLCANANYGSCPSTLPDGQYTVRAKVYDAAGNRNISTNLSFTVDNNAPDAPTLASPKDGTVINGKSITQSWSDGSGDIDHYVYESCNDANCTSRRWGNGVNGEGIYPAGQTSKTATNVGETAYWWRVKAVDKAGNESGWSDIWKITVDNTAPIATITAPSTINALRGTVTVSGTVTDANPDHYYFVVKDSTGRVVAGPGVVYAASVADWQWDTTNVADGTYTIDLEARDAAGNKDAGSTATLTVTVDNTAPGTVSNLTHSVSGSNVTWNWDAATDATSGVAGYILDLVDSNGNRVASFPVTTPDNTLTKSMPLPDDTYTFSVWAVDNAGNEGAITTVTVVVDTVAPAIVINGYGKNGNVIQPNITVDGSSTPTGYTYSWTTDPDVAISNTSALNPTFTVNKYGNYSFTLTVTDASGNASNAIFSFSYPKPVTPSTTPTFTNVNTAPGNNGRTVTGTTTPTPLTNNGTGTTTPQVLGASTNGGKVKGDSTVNVENSSSKQQNKDTGNSQFLGLGWWWLPILLIILAAWWILFGPRRKSEAN